ncbi:MAG: carbamoyltransferase [Acidobacteria bacterium]|nr:MAG: carbamoyltransferase [Acidobacteriota bacterium]
MNVVGISAFYHQSTCCLLRDGTLVAAASEERFSRAKHDPRLPVEAFRFCLRRGGLDLTGVDAVAYYEPPRRKLARQLWAGPAADDELAWLDPEGPLQAIRRGLGWEGAIDVFPHHLCHAASAFFYSGFDEAAILVADGVGAWATTSYGRGAGRQLELFEQVVFPHSLGLLYATVTAYLGFPINDGEGRVMGLAAYGEPRFVDQVCQLIGMGPDGQYRLNLRYFDFLRGERMYAPALCELFGAPPRRPGEAIGRFHQDVARSLQLVVEETLLEKLRYLHQRTGAGALAMAGGVALNAVANGRIRRQGPFERLFVQPAAGDAGAALGAAALAHAARTGRRPGETLRHVFYGPRYAAEEIDALLRATGVACEDYRGRHEALAEAIAERLAAGKVVGFFHGAMELGPRALGGRSILASPLEAGMRQRLNQRVKRREDFRPFAPSVLAAHAAEHLDLAGPAPFMVETCAVRSPFELPAITHADGSTRPQIVDPEVCPRFAAVLAAFHRRTGCPLLLNTSLNVRGEPIVCSPVDALFCFADAGLDCLALEDFLIDRTPEVDRWRQLLAAWERAPRSVFARRRSAIAEHLYTFV